MVARTDLNQTFGLCMWAFTQRILLHYNVKAVNILLPGIEFMWKAMDSVDHLPMLREAVKLWLILDRIDKQTDIPEVCCQRLCTFC